MGLAWLEFAEVLAGVVVELLEAPKVLWALLEWLLPYTPSAPIIATANIITIPFFIPLQFIRPYLNLNLE